MMITKIVDLYNESMDIHVHVCKSMFKFDNKMIMIMMLTMMMKIMIMMLTMMKKIMIMMLTMMKKIMIMMLTMMKKIMIMMLTMMKKIMMMTTFDHSFTNKKHNRRQYKMIHL